MLIAEFAKTSKIPLKTLRHMVKKDVIHEELSDLDLHVLLSFEKIWADFDVLRPQVRKFNQEKRKFLIQTCDFDSKWERWAYTRMMKTPLDEKMSIKKIISQVEFTFLFKLQPWQVSMIYKVREKAYKDRKTLRAAAEKPDIQHKDNE